MKLPFAGRVYVDSPILIYTIEHNPPFAALLRQFWTAVAASAVEVVTSELSILETLVNPICLGDSPVIAEYEEFFALPEIQCWPIDRGILRRAA